MVTTKKRAIDYTQKEMRKEFKHFIINQLNTEDDSNAGNKDKKAKKQVRAK